jgi:cytochrome c5
MKKIVLSLSSILMASLLIVSCTNKKEAIEYPTNTCDTSISRFSVEVKQVFTAYCYSCHSTANALSLGGGNDLQDYQTVKAYADFGRLMSDINFSGGNNMPKNGTKMPGCQINKILAWINKGAKND